MRYFCVILPKSIRRVHYKILRGSFCTFEKDSRIWSILIILFSNIGILFRRIGRRSYNTPWCQWSENNDSATRKIEHWIGHNLFARWRLEFCTGPIPIRATRSYQIRRHYCKYSLAFECGSHRLAQRDEQLRIRRVSRRDVGRASRCCALCSKSDSNLTPKSYASIILLLLLRAYLFLTRFRSQKYSIPVNYLCSRFTNCITFTRT